jgi:hypothetical protein
LATVWQSYAHATAIKADPSYPAFIQDRDALATGPVYEVHASYSGDLQRELEAPVTEVDYYTMNPDVRPTAEAQEMIRRVPPLMEPVQGFIASSAAVGIEEENWGVYICGWRAVEVRSFCIFHAFSPHSSLCIPIVSKNFKITFLFLLTGPYAFGHDRKT